MSMVKSRTSLVSLVVGLLVVAVFGFGATAAAASKDTLVYAIDVDIANLDPIHAIDPGSAAVYQQIYDPLVRFNMKGDIVPVLAESWSVSADKVTWTFKLKKGVNFTDGTPFNAAAVKYHLDRLLDPNKPNRSAGQFSMIKSSKVVDDYTINIVLDKPYAPFLALMANPTMSIPSPTAVKKYGDKYPLNPVGSGPFIFKDWVSGSHTTLVRNDNYWGGKPAIKELVFKPVSEPGARVIMLETGEADVINSVFPEEMIRLEKNKNLAILKQPVLRGWFIGMNNLMKPFDDVRVRRAMNYAIDVEVITDEIYRGTAAPLTSAVNSKVFGHVAQPDYEYNPAKARQLLKEAGYANGFTVNLIHPVSGAGFMPEVPQAVQAMLAEVGINLNLVPLEMSAFVDNIIKDPKASEQAGKHMIMAGIGAGTGEAANIMHEFYHTGSWAPVKYNRIFYSNPKVDAILDEAIQTFDTNKQKKLMADAQKLIWEDAPWVFFYEMMGIYGARSNVKGLEFIPSNYILFHNVAK